MAVAPVYPNSTPTFGFAPPPWSAAPTLGSADFNAPQPSYPSPTVTNPFSVENPVAAKPPAPVAPQPTPFSFSKGAGAAAAGLAGAAPPSASVDAASAGVNVGEGVLAGTLSGAVIGGPVGAVVGGVTGLIASGLNAWLGVRGARKQARDTQALIAAAQAKQDARDKQARDDAIGQEGYNRDQVRKAQLYQVYKDQMTKMGNLVANSDELKKAWVSNGWVK